MNAIIEPPRCIADFETRSKKKLGRSKENCGAARYAQDPSTQILVLRYKLPGDVEPRRWRPGNPFPRDGEPINPFPQDLIDFVLAGGCIEAHNAFFEQCIWRYILHDRYGVPMPTKWRDTMATCAYRSLPLGLDDVGEVLDLDVKKDKRGKYLLDKLTSWKKPTKKKPGHFVEDPALLDELDDYCGTDVLAEESLGHKLGDLPRSEYLTWALDQKINHRGVQVDVEAVNGAIKIVESLEKGLNEELSHITAGVVGAGTEVEKIQGWLASREWALEDLTKDTVKRAVRNPDAPADVRRVLEIRQQLSRASTKKLYAMLKWLCSDGRLRGLLQFHAAGTGRWGGRGPQPQNFPRPDEILMKLFGIDGVVDALRTGAIDVAEIISADVGEVLASSLRGMFISGPGKDLLAADFSAIEARMLAWMAGEQWKLDAFAAIDRGEGYQGSEDIYCATASKIVGYPVLNKKTHPMERQVYGKVPELAFGYQGSVGAWRGFDKREPGDKGYVPDHDVKKFCDGWREAHPETRQLWWGLDDAGVQAVQTGQRCSYRSISFEMVEDAAGPWLTMILPNGRRLWYFKPFTEWNELPSGKKKLGVCFWGADSKHGGAWTVCRGYGGLWSENAVQAASRDVMVEAMFRVEKLGYPIILTVHDEVVTEPDEGHGSLEEFEKAMSVVPVWCQGLPLAVEGWRGKRYRK